MHPLIAHAAEVAVARNSKNWVPRAFLGAFLMSSSDADHITSMKTEVWPWHLGKHVWLGCFLIRGWKQGLPNSGACLWRGSFIKVGIQSRVLLSARCSSTAYGKLASLQVSSIHTKVNKKGLVRQLGKRKAAGGRVSHLCRPSMDMVPFSLVGVTSRSSATLCQLKPFWHLGK